jgi:DNA mismatch repair protein MutL
MIGAFRSGPVAYAHSGPASGHRAFNPSSRATGGAGFDYQRSPARPLGSGLEEGAQAAFDAGPLDSGDARAGAAAVDETLTSLGLGAARAQIHENYIVAQTRDSLVIVDQHAAHERLVYEALKQALRARPMPAQILLLPEIVDLPQDDVARLAAHAETLQRFGLAIERFGPGAIAVRETPAMLGEIDAAALLRDLADEIADNDTVDTLQARLDRIAATMACHGSVRAGDALSASEAQALLVALDDADFAGHCPHGRPVVTYMSWAELERKVGRR